MFQCLHLQFQFPQRVLVLLLFLRSGVVRSNRENVAPMLADVGGLCQPEAED